MVSRIAGQCLETVFSRILNVLPSSFSVVVGQSFCLPDS